MPTVRTRAGELAYDELGTGAPLLLVHSAAHDRRDWDSIRTELAGQYRTVAVDQPAHGVEPRAPVRLAAERGRRRRPRRGRRRRAGPRPDERAGFLGGRVRGGRLAIRRPEAVRALVLVYHGGFGDYPLGVRLFCRAMGLPPLPRLLYPGFARRFVSMDTGHLPFTSDPAAFLAHVLPFLAAVPAG